MAVDFCGTQHLYILHLIETFSDPGESKMPIGKVRICRRFCPVLDKLSPGGWSDCDWLVGFF